MSTSPWFWNILSRTYADSPIKDEEGYADSLERIRKHVKSNHNLLEVACGTGTTALRLAASVRSIVATDFSPALVNICKERQKDASPPVDNVTFQVGLAAEPPGQATSYDGVLIMNALPFLSEPSIAMDALVTKLSSGGVFVSKSFCFGDKWLMRAVVAVPQFLRIMPRLNFFTPSELEKLHTDAGLNILETKVYEKCGRRLIIAQKPE